MIIRILLGIIIVFIVFMITIGLLFFRINGGEQKDKETIYKGSGKGKVLVIYQESRMGITKKAVNRVSEEFQKEGYTVVTNHPRKSLTYNVQDYDIIVLASPVYAAKVSEPLLAFEKSQDFMNKKVMVLLTGAFVDVTKELDEVAGEIKNASTVRKIKVDQVDERITNEVKGVIQG